MLGAISSLSSGMSGSNSISSQIRTPVTGNIGTDARFTAPMLNESSGSADTAGISQLLTTVAELMRNVGGDLQNDKMVQMLVALMILLALLHSFEGGDAKGQNTIEGLGSATYGAAGTAGTYSSATFISFEQTTTTISLYSSNSYDADTNDSASPSRGGTVDLSA